MRRVQALYPEITDPDAIEVCNEPLEQVLTTRKWSTRNPQKHIRPHDYSYAYVNVQQALAQGPGSFDRHDQCPESNIAGTISLENFYEEIASTNERLTMMQLRERCAPTAVDASAASHSVGSLTQTPVQEEQRLVQSRHHRTLGQLNLCVEAMLMPDSPPSSPESVSSPLDVDCELIRPLRFEESEHRSIDLDSGFSGSSSDGVTHIAKLRLHKTQAAHTIRLAREAAKKNTAIPPSDTFTRSTFQRAKTLAHFGSNGRNNCKSKVSNIFVNSSCAKNEQYISAMNASKARTFWTAKRWRNKLSGFASTSSTKVASSRDEHTLNFGQLVEKPPTAVTAEFHACCAYNHRGPHLINNAEPIQWSDYQADDICVTGLATNGSTIAGGSVGVNGGASAAVGVSTRALAEATSSANSSNGSTSNANHNSPKQHDEDDEQSLSVPTANNAASIDDECFDEKCNGSASSAALNASNQRNSQLRSTFNRAKQHLSFDKWRLSSNSTAHYAGGKALSNGSGGNLEPVGGQQYVRRASECTLPTMHQQQAQPHVTPPREELNSTAAGESPGGRLSRWFSMRRGSTHQYDMGARHSTSASSIDIPDSSALGVSLTSTLNCSSGSEQHHSSPLKQLKSAYTMPGVPENEDDDVLSASATRLALDLILPTESRAHTRMITPMLPPAPPGLSQQQLKRRHIVAAIVHSENSYVATLQRLVYDYKKPLEESSPPVLSAGKIGTLFHSLPEILQSHKMFRIALAECVRHWDRDEKLGDCFVSAFSKAPILDNYSGFINNFSIAMELAKMEEKRKSALADFFKVKQISAHDRLSFFGLMVKPVQRFPQFILFLQDLLKYTPQGHHDRMSLQLALTQLELLAEMLNERKREAEQYQAFKEMIAHISGTFQTRTLSAGDGQRTRYLLREDNVTHMEFNQAGFIVKSKARRLLLLNDRVICVSVAPKQSHDFGASEKLTFKWMYPVGDVEIVENSTSATLSRILTAGLNRGGSLKANCNTSGSGGGGGAGDSHSLPHSGAAATAALLTNGADNLGNEMSTLMHDYEVISRIQDLLGSLKGAYKELQPSVTRNLLNAIQASIQRKDEEMAWVDSCCMQLIARHKSGREESYTFQTKSPHVKKEWITELRLAQLALDANNSPAWELAVMETAALPPYVQPQSLSSPQKQKPRQSNKMPLFVKAMPVYKSQHQTEVRCGCYYNIANDSRPSTRRRHRQQNYLWVCASDGTSSHIGILSQHHQRAGQLRDVSSFDLVEIQVTAIEFVKGVDTSGSEEHSVGGGGLHGDLIWMGTSSRRLLIYSARNPEQEQQLSSCSLPGAVQRILYHMDAVYVACAHATLLIYRRCTTDSVWQLNEPQLVQLGESALPVASLLPINMNVYAACANRVYVLNALNGEVQRSFEVQHGHSQQVNLMAHSGIGLWISLRNSTLLCLYHTETFKHLQDINIASSILRGGDSKKEQTVNNSAIFVTALMACRGLLWVGTNVGIAVTIPLPRLEGVPIISGGISISRHAHFGPITFLLPLIPKTYMQSGGGGSGGGQKVPTQLALPATVAAAVVPPTPSMGDDLQLPAIDADEPKPCAAVVAAEDEDSIVILRRDLPSTEASGAAAVTTRAAKLDKQHSLDHAFSAKIRASLAASPALPRRRFRDMLATESSTGSARISKTLPRGLGSARYSDASSSGHSNASTLTHGEHSGCDVYGLYGKLIFVKEDYETDTGTGTQRDMIDTMYDCMRRSDPELAAIPGRVSTLDRRLRMKAARPRSLDLSNWSVDSKSSSLYTSSGSEESVGFRFFNGRSVSRNSSSASHKTSANGSDLSNISEHTFMATTRIQEHEGVSGCRGTLKSTDSFSARMQRTGATAVAEDSATQATAAGATLKRKQKQTAKQQQLLSTDGPRTVITLMGGRGYWRHVWYGTASMPPAAQSKSATLNSSGGGSSPLIANSNDAHIVVWEKKL